jgi:hypothetical protein
MPTIPVFERAKTFHALDCAVTVIGKEVNTLPNFRKRFSSSELKNKVRLSKEGTSIY